MRNKSFVAALNKKKSTASNYNLDYVKEKVSVNNAK
jgi:hypothetical protein